MLKQIQIVLLVILTTSFFIGTNAYAELKENPKTFLQGLAKKVRHSVRSLGSIDLLSVVRGTITLIAPKKLSCLDGSIASVYQGNSNNLRKRKSFKVSGSSEDGIFLEGRGGAGEGYTVSGIETPPVLNFLPRKRSNKDSGSLGSVRINFSDNFGQSEVIFDKGKYKAVRSKNSAAYKGTFQKRLSGRCGFAKGRFNLKLTRR